MSKVVDLHPDRPTVKRVLESVLENHEGIANVIVLVETKEGDIFHARSEMTIKDASLLSRYHETQVNDEIRATMDYPDDEEEG